MSIAFPLLIAASKIADLFNARPLGDDPTARYRILSDYDIVVGATVVH
jgi:hypothetical protein